MSSAHPRRRVRWTSRAAVLAWSALFTADAVAFAEIVPWLPTQLHSLAVGGCVAVTCAALLIRIQVPVRAAFMAGMLAERGDPGALKVEPLPMASGDDTGGGRVIDFQRPSSGGHRQRPAPYPRDPGRR